MEDSDQTKQVVRVTIFNQTYTVSTAGDPQQIVELAAEIDELMSSIARRAGNLDTTRTAVLACLHLADRLRAVEQELSSFRTSVSSKTRNFASILDQVFTATSGPESNGS
ncbi:MAG: cell division protein ZapA [Acidobacteriaceae bacterium]|nr:cell division protein ZapA [Acidobacteriaceae bacterium]